MPRVRHEMSTMRHQIAKQGEVTIVDFGALELNDAAQLPENCGPSSFDTENVEDFNAAVRVGAFEIHPVNTHHGLQVGALSFHYPLLMVSRVYGACIVNEDLVVGHKECTLDARNATQADRLEHGVL